MVLPPLMIKREELGNIFDPHLAHDITAVHFDCTKRDTQLIGDLLASQAGNHQLKNLGLPGGKDLKPLGQVFFSVCLYRMADRRTGLKDVKVEQFWA